MALAVTEEHQALADSVSGWAERNAGPETIRAAVEASEGAAGNTRGAADAAGAAGAAAAAGTAAAADAAGAADGRGGTDGRRRYDPESLLASLADQGLLGLH